MTEKIKIAGAGISGLIAAINLAKAGYEVEIYDSAKDSGQRFSGDFQGIENWSYKQDALDFLKDINIEPNFDYNGVDKHEIWAPGEIQKEFVFSRPIYYLVKRGADSDCLDQALKKQALNSGVKIFYNHPIKREEADIVATGPVLNDSVIDGFVSGYVFKTDIGNINIAIFDNKYAPRGYSYFFVHNSLATIATCIFKNFNKIDEYREKTLELCKKRKHFKMGDVRRFSGSGNFFLPRIPKDRKIYIGEAGGFQDYLFGFGMRYAMVSGYYAARSIIEGKDFYKICKKEIFPKMRTSVVNRFIFALLSNRTYKWLIGKYGEGLKDQVKFAGKLYNSRIIRKILFPFVKIFYKKHIKDPRNV